MEYLKIKNWDKWQTYRNDRGQPPWIKIHRRIRMNPEWVELSDCERGQLVAIWLLAADKEGAIPASSEMIKKLCFMQNPPDLNKFTDLGFIEDGRRRNDAGTTPERLPNDVPKAEKNRIDKTLAQTTTQMFTQFWGYYPKKRNKGDAEKAFKTLKIDNILLNKILISIKQSKQSKQWLKNDGEFIPYPATWIRAKGWEDEVTVIPKTKSSLKYVDEIVKERGF